MATETDKVNNGALATLVAVGTLATLAVILGVYALVRYETNTLSAERAEYARERYEQVVASQRDKLTTPGWVDESKGIVSIPIEKAKSQVLADLARDPSSASPPPAPSAAPAEAAPDGELGAVPAASGSALAAAPAAPAAPGSTAAPTSETASAAPVSPKASTVLAVPAAPPAAPVPAPAPAAPAPSDG